MASALQQVLSAKYMTEVLNGKIIKPTFSHLALYVGLIIYTAFGAKIFHILEHPLEKEKLERLYSSLLTSRNDFLTHIFNGSWNSLMHRNNIDKHLLEYERTVANAACQGIDLDTKTIHYEWDYIQAVFFASTILTTIGYGNIAPVGIPGRVFCIIFAIVGIPFTLSVIADIGQIFATLVSVFWRKYKYIFISLRNKIKTCMKRKKLRKFDELEDEENDDEDEGFGGNTFTAFCALLLLTWFLCISALIFQIWEDWSFFDAFYFCFITTTTIGFGDMVPNISGIGYGKSGYMLVCMIYILVGLALTSTIIELVRRQYKESWEKMQELRAQIQAQIKLAATLSKLGDRELELEEMEIDVEALKKKIRLMKKGRFGKELKDLNIEDLKLYEGHRRVKAVTILLYETSL